MPPQEVVLFSHHPLLPCHPETHSNIIFVLIGEIVFIIRPFILLFIEFELYHAGPINITVVKKKKQSSQPNELTYGGSNKKWKNNKINTEHVRCYKMLGDSLR